MIGTSDVEREIRVRAFDPDGSIERAVLEVNGIPVATNSSGNVSFRRMIAQSGDYEFRLTVTDRSGLTASELILFRAVSAGFPGSITVSRDEDAVLIGYDGFSLEESIDLRNWTEVHAGGGEFRTNAGGDYRFYRSTH